MNFKKGLLGLFILLLTSYVVIAQKSANSVKIVGQMKDVMWKGQLYGNINLDTLPHKTNLYGLGPVEYLSGEILILDGISYKSSVISDANMKVEETYDLKAPFFGYANVSKWEKWTLPTDIQNFQQLEQYLDLNTKSYPRPFLFKISGIIEHATIHIVNLPKGSTVSSPNEAHQGQKNYQIKKEDSEIIGFFSTDHKAIFTHHDTFLHIHLITKDRQKMGHLDEILFGKEPISLYLPME